MGEVIVQNYNAVLTLARLQKVLPLSSPLSFCSIHLYISFLCIHTLFLSLLYLSIFSLSISFFNFLSFRLSILSSLSPFLIFLFCIFCLLSLSHQFSVISCLLPTTTIFPSCFSLIKNYMPWHFYRYSRRHFVYLPGFRCMHSNSKWWNKRNVHTNAEVGHCWFSWYK